MKGVRDNRSCESIMCASLQEVQQRAIQALADVTSKSVEQFHKAGELVLMQKDQEKSYTDRAQNLAR